MKALRAKKRSGREAGSNKDFPEIKPSGASGNTPIQELAVITSTASGTIDVLLKRVRWRKEISFLLVCGISGSCRQQLTVLS